MGRLARGGVSVPAMLPLIQGHRESRLSREMLRVGRCLASYLGKTPEERRKLGSKTYDYVVDNHGIEEFKESYLRLIQEGLNKREIS